MSTKSSCRVRTTDTTGILIIILSEQWIELLLLDLLVEWTLGMLTSNNQQGLGLANWVVIEINLTITIQGVLGGKESNLFLDSKLLQRKT